MEAEFPLSLSLSLQRRGRSLRQCQPQGLQHFALQGSFEELWLMGMRLVKLKLALRRSWLSPSRVEPHVDACQRGQDIGNCVA